jgi:hypothetical protein
MYNKTIPVNIPQVAVMKKIVVFTLFFWLLPGLAGAAPLAFTTINQSVVADKLMPVGTMVKVRVVRKSDQFNAILSLDCFPENVFTRNKPSNLGFWLRRWLAVDLREGDVLTYTTARRCFIGFSADSDYRRFSVNPLTDGYQRITMDHRFGHRWVIDVAFPDYDF